MGNAGARHFVVKDSSLSTEIFVSGSSRESAFEMINSTIEGTNRVKRDLGTLTLPLPTNVTILDNNLFNWTEAMDALWVVIMLNLMFSLLIFIQFGTYLMIDQNFALYSK